jgi:hypothetical protein
MVFGEEYGLLYPQVVNWQLMRSAQGYDGGFRAVAKGTGCRSIYIVYIAVIETTRFILWILAEYVRSSPSDC